MAPYALALILLLGIPFLLYCLWNFARELKPRKSRVFAHSSLPAWGSVPAMPMSRPSRQIALFKSRSKVVDRLDRDYPRPARAS
jgi:hypothetical protein